MNRTSRSCYLFADGVNIRAWNGENDPISPIDCPFFPLAPAALAPDPCRVRHCGGCHFPPMPPPDAGPQAPMTAPGTWSSPPRGAIAVPATASPSPSSAAAFHRPAVAGSRARSIAPGPLRSEFRLAHPGRVAAAGSPAPAARAPGAASSPATAAAAPGRRRGAERSRASPCERRNPDAALSIRAGSETPVAINNLRWLRENGPPQLRRRDGIERSAMRISAAPAPSRPGGLRNARPARPWRTRRRRP